MKRNSVFVLALFAMMLFVSCGSEKPDDSDVSNDTEKGVIYMTATPTTKVYSIPSGNDEPQITPVVIDNPEEGDPYFEASTLLDKKLGRFYSQVFDDSYLSIGNTYRMKEKLTKAKAGEDITVLFIGGSVTEGANATEKTPKNLRKGYAYITYEYIRDTFGTGDGSNVKYVNVGISGTSSSLGMVRVQKDVIDYHPDIVFVEFAVNNDTSAYDRMTYESLLRRILNSDTEPAVFLLFSAATYAGSAQQYMVGYGNYYDLPMMSMHNGLKNVQNMGFIKWEDFSNDTVHPMQDGHYLYAKCICRMIKKIWEKGEDTSYTVPEAPSIVGFDVYENTVLLDNTDENGLIADTGCFEAVDTTYSSTGLSDNRSLGKGWTKKASVSDPDAPMTIKLKCSTFSIVVKQMNATKETSLDVYVDGVKKTEMVTEKSGAWNNPYVYLIIKNEEPAEHVIEIRTNETTATRQATILAMSYTE